MRRIRSPLSSQNIRELIRTSRVSSLRPVSIVRRRSSEVVVGSHFEIIKVDPTVPEIRIRLPYDPNWSKNRMWRKSGTRIYRSQEYRRLRDALAALIAVHRLPWRTKKKLCVQIYVIRPDMRLDVQNLVDAICDAVRDGTGVGDNYFAGDWDWRRSSEGEKPAILLRIVQIKANRPRI